MPPASDGVRDELRDGLGFRTAECVRDMRSQDAGVREEALISLADIAAPFAVEVIEHVVLRLEDTEPRVRAAAVAALQSVRDQVDDEVVEGIAERLAVVQDDEVKVAILAGVYVCDPKSQSVEACAADVLSRSTVNVKLLEMSDPGTQEEEGEEDADNDAEELTDVRDRMTMAALQVLAKPPCTCGSAEVMQVVKCVRHPRRIVRAAALATLAATQSSDIIADVSVDVLLARAMSDACADCRFLAVMGLGAVCPPRRLNMYQQELGVVMCDEVGEVRAAAAAALGGVEEASDESLQRLIVLVEDDELRDVRRAAFVALIDLSGGEGRAAAAAAAAVEKYGEEVMGEAGSVEEELAEAGAPVDELRSFMDFLESDGEIASAGEGGSSSGGIDGSMEGMDANQKAMMEQLLKDAGEGELFVPEQWLQQSDGDTDED